MSCAFSWGPFAAGQPRLEDASSFLPVGLMCFLGLRPSARNCSPLVAFLPHVPKSIVVEDVLTVSSLTTCHWVRLFLIPPGEPKVWTIGRWIVYCVSASPHGVSLCTRMLFSSFLFVFFCNSSGILSFQEDPISRPTSGINLLCDMGPLTQILCACFIFWKRKVFSKLPPRHAVLGLWVLCL